MNCYLFSCFFFSHLSTVTFFPVTFFPVTFFPTWNCYFLSCYLFSCYFLSVHRSGYDCMTSWLILSVIWYNMYMMYNYKKDITKLARHQPCVTLMVLQSPLVNKIWALAVKFAPGQVSLDNGINNLINCVKNLVLKTGRGGRGYQITKLAVTHLILSRRPVKN